MCARRFALASTSAEARTNQNEHCVNPVINKGRWRRKRVHQCRDGFKASRARLFLCAMDTETFFRDENRSMRKNPTRLRLYRPGDVFWFPWLYGLRRRNWLRSGSYRGNGCLTYSADRGDGKTVIGKTRHQRRGESWEASTANGEEAEDRVEDVSAASVGDDVRLIRDPDGKAGSPVNCGFCELEHGGRTVALSRMAAQGQSAASRN